MRSKPFSLLGRITKWPLICLIGCSFLYLGMAVWIAPPSGLDQSVAVGPYVNGSFTAQSPSEGSGNWQVTNAFPNISVSRPIFLAEEPGTNRLFIGEHQGRIYAFPNDPNASNRELVLDIRDQTWYSGESGLLSFAFHPRYGVDSNYLYVFYQYDGNLNYSRLSRFTISQETGAAVEGSELVLIQLYDRASNHNAGMIFFGLDGYLYVSTGDEGGGNNEFRNSQSITERHLGGVLRIDVDRDLSRSHPIRRQPELLRNNDQSFTANYYIPNDNPWLDPNGGVLEEFYAIGLRNPHRMSQDPVSGLIWLADVGQGRREEVDLIVKGGNYQWGYREGFLTGPQSKPSPLIGTDQPPIHEYPHSEGKSVTGGYVYRGGRLPSLQGAYVYADYNTRRLWILRENASGNYEREQLMTTPFAVSSFGVDNAGELYLLNWNGGNIQKLVRQNQNNPNFPTLLSETGVFSNLSPLTPESFCIPYDLNVPFWSDGAAKQRWMILPNDGQPNSPEEQIQYSESGDWIFPAGAVLVKHFELPLDTQNPSLTRKLETRFLIFGDNNSFYGVSYRWNEAQTDAILIQEAIEDTLTIQAIEGPKQVSWFFPGQNDCFSCHTAATSGALGAKTGQLNKDFLYPSTNRTANQLKSLAHLNFLSPPPDTNNLNTLPYLAPTSDLSQSLEARARAYLDANCSSCHRSGTVIQANFDARISAPVNDQALIYGEVFKELGIAGSRTILPGDLEKSVLYRRLKSVHSEIAMPQIAKNEVDSAGLQLIEEWILSLAPNSSYGGKMGQQIHMNPLPNQLTSAPNFALQGSSTSGLPISYQVIEGPATVSGAQVSLTGGSGRVIMEATQGGNGSFHPAPADRQSFWVLPQGRGMGTGLRGTYFSSIDLSNPAFERIDPTIQFNWNSASPLPSQMGYDGYSVRWEGELEVPYGETYTFTTRADDGIRLWVNNQLLIDNWQADGLSEHSGSISLSAWDRVPIRIEFFESQVYASVELFWSSTQIAPEPIPSTFLYPSGGTESLIHLWLEGFFNPSLGKMENSLLANDLLPLQQPFNLPPFNYEGTESVASWDIPILDWVLLEVRSANSPYPLVERQAALLREDGILVNTAFQPRFLFPGLAQGSYRLAIYARSHLAVLSSENLSYTPTQGLPSYRFSDPTKVSGNSSLKAIDTTHALYTGDFDFNGNINSQDFNQWKQNSAALNQYLIIDADGNGIINNSDFNLWRANVSKLAVPEVQR